MSVFLISLRISNELKVTHRDGDKITGESKISEAGFQAELMLTPDREGLDGLGMLRMTVSGSAPKGLPEMTPQQTAQWLTETIKKML
ncbi:MAG: hypothetical protein WDN49_18475 [Acetobacteraceae bacterium]